MSDILDPRKKLAMRHKRLKALRSSYDVDAMRCAEMFNPARGRFNNEKAEARGSRYSKIIDNTGLLARRTLSSGLLAGMSSPARPWFRLGVQDGDLAKSAPVARWLDDTTRAMRKVFETSNTYRSLRAQYDELATFGVSAALSLFDTETVTHDYPLTFGEYVIATDTKGRPNTLYREFRKPVYQMVAEFGDRCSDTVQDLYKRGNFDESIQAVHAIEPRLTRNVDSPLTKDMPFVSTYFEPDSNNSRTLEESGFEIFPAMISRWDTVGTAVYGDGVALEAVGDARQLQHQQLRKGQAIDMMVVPPLQAPSSLAERGISRAPNSVTFVDGVGPDQKIQSLYDVRMDPNLLLEDINDIRQRVKSAFYADLFLMLLNDTRNMRATATEIAEKHEEKFVMLGPVIERLHDEVLMKRIDITFHHMLRAGLVPTPPPELEQQQLKVTFTSVLAQAQQMVGLGTIERMLNFTGSMAALVPDAMDKIKTDTVIADYADILGVDPDSIRSDDEVRDIREARAKKQQLQEMAALAQQAGSAAKDLSQVNTDQPNPLTDVLTGYVGQQ